MSRETRLTTADYLQLIKEIKRLNQDPGVHGIIVQLPLQSDKPISQDKITNLVSPDKDVDGYVIVCAIDVSPVPPVSCFEWSSFS